MTSTDVLVVGAGPAGLAAGAYLARAGWRTVIVDPDPPGGKARRLGVIETYPGFPRGITGRALMRRFELQALRWGARLLRERACGIGARGRRFRLLTSGGTLGSRAVLLCSGTAFRGLGGTAERGLPGLVRGPAPSPPRLRGRDVVVAGGGEAAAYEALRLAEGGARVTLVCRAARLKAIGRLRRSVDAHPGVRLLAGGVVSGGGARSVRVETPGAGPARALAADAVVVMAGQRPERGLARPFSGRRAPAGFFLAGDVRLGLDRQVAVAAADGLRAAMSCERYLRGDR